MTPALTCSEVGELIDAFLDAELPAPMLLAVARHAAGCPGCDAEVRERTAVHEVVEQTMNADAEALDLSGLWPAVAAGVTRVDRRRSQLRRLRSAPLWGAAGLAMAATALFWFQGVDRPASEGPRVVASRRPNDAVIDRITSQGAHVAMRRERKNGTMYIMVSADEAVR